MFYDSWKIEKNLTCWAKEATYKRVNNSWFHLYQVQNWANQTYGVRGQKSVSLLWEVSVFQASGNVLFLHFGAGSTGAFSLWKFIKLHIYHVSIKMKYEYSDNIIDSWTTSSLNYMGPTYIRGFWGFLFVLFFAFIFCFLSAKSFIVFIWCRAWERSPGWLKSCLVAVGRGSGRSPATQGDTHGPLKGPTSWWVSPPHLGSGSPGSHRDGSLCGQNPEQADPEVLILL